MNRVRIRRLGEIVDCPHLHRRHGGRDIALAGKDDDAGALARLTQRLDDIQAAAVRHAQIDNREFRL